MAFFFALISAVYVLLYSYSTSPLYPYYYGNDAAQFLTIGKGWAEGLLPYRDLFDHKGPVVFFVNMLGYRLTGSKYGVAAIQICFLFAAILAICGILRLEEKSRIYIILCVMIALIIMRLNYGTGDTTGEFCLPLLCWSFYGIFSYFSRIKDKTEHDFRWAFLYGITAGICFMTRATNVSPIAVGVIVITFRLLLRKQFRNLYENALAFIVGFLGIMLPFMLYFHWKGVLYEAFYATFLYNAMYLDKMEPWILWAEAKNLRAFCRDFFVWYSVFFSSLIRFIKRDRLVGTVLLLTGILEGVIFLGGANFSNYAIVCLPQFVLFLNEVYSLLRSGRTDHRFLAGFMMFLTGELCVLSLSGNMSSFLDYRQSYAVHNERKWEKLFNEIPEEERDSFVVYGENQLKEIYLLTGTMPYYKYFIVQDWHGGFSDKVHSEIYELFRDGDARWILTDEYTEIIGDILETRYELYDTAENYKLYRLSDEPAPAWAQELRETTEFEAYLTKLRETETEHDIISIFAVKDIQGYCLTRDMTDLLAGLGLQDAEKLLEHKYHPYIGVSQANQRLYEAVGSESETYTFTGNGAEIHVTSACLKSGNSASVSVNGRELAVNKRGINIVVLDGRGRLVDTVSFDTHARELTCTRK